jgi:N6-adenosine-specific RNA methylase IME4
MRMKLPERYTAAKRALAAATRIDEVADIRNKSIAMEVYAYQAKDVELIAAATELRKRAERAIGVLMAKDRDAGRMAKGGAAKGVGRKGKQCGSPTDPHSGPTLADQGVDKHLADRARKAADMEEAKFEASVAKSIKIAVAAVENEKAVIKAAREDAQKEKRAKRAKRERELAGKIAALPDKKYGVIVSDPEWQYEPWSRETGMDRAAANHYPTSVLPVIMARDVPSIAADDCVLFLWATIPMLPHALVVMAAWAFDYVSHYAWGKDKIGTGFWSREKHELMLIGTRGHVPCPAQGDQWASLILAPRGEHSAKPECILEMLDAYFPNLPKIELNRRGPPRPGWDAWGNEAETENQQAAE